MNTPPTTTAAPAQSRTQRATDGLLVIIVLAVGTMAGAASFTHVHDWTLDHSPAGTASWLGWANAVITELVPTASLITIARRRRTGGHTAYPTFLLVVAVGFSLTAQLAVAEPSAFGWMVSALPSLAFFALSKLVFSATKHTATTTDQVTAPADQPATVDQAVMEALTARIAHLESRPTTVSANPSPAPARASSSSATGTARTIADSSTTRPNPIQEATDHNGQAPTPNPVDPIPAPAVAVAPVVVMDKPTGEATSAGLGDLLPTARLYARSHRQSTGEDITKGQLAVRMSINTTTADRLLRAINGTTGHTDTPAISGPHNGSRPFEGVNA